VLVLSSPLIEVYTWLKSGKGCPLHEFDNGSFFEELNKIDRKAVVNTYCRTIKNAVTALCWISRN